ncbi:hypothetical protein NPIL_255171 [Nephila pilipes]|uniref:Uncharacterized protein n=1 Tax=Nephila pilipes TaxID=299642 RepID=A0A8X6UAC6_NEPPI|nr:hypothetical protein NPIL_255171 [Nephila pilipes]
MVKKKIGPLWRRGLEFHPTDLPKTRPHLVTFHSMRPSPVCKSHRVTLLECQREKTSLSQLMMEEIITNSTSKSKHVMSNCSEKRWMINDLIYIR